MSVLGGSRLIKGGVGVGGGGGENSKELPIVFNDTETSFCKASKSTYFCYKLLWYGDSYGVITPDNNIFFLKTISYIWL